MRKVIGLLVFVFVANFAFAQSSKTLVKTLNPSSSKYVALDFDGEVKTEEWDRSSVRVLLNVTIENGSEKVLKGLVAAGRYNLKTTRNGDNFEITVPGLKKQVIFKGEDLKESVTAVIYLPKYVEAKIQTDGAKSRVLIEKGVVNMEELENMGFASKGATTNFEEIDFQVTITLAD